MQSGNGHCKSLASRPLCLGLQEEIFWVVTSGEMLADIAVGILAEMAGEMLVEIADELLVEMLVEVTGEM